ncbi:MAG: hypothetical protein O2999_14645 [Nitrospirae bacterium]|nr:hypothetical protein [Nitrospirota bacterium]MDA1305499.1 hypothetical protein [Nitrospirota bacterium]
MDSTTFPLKTVFSLLAICSLLGCSSVDMPELAMPEMNLPGVNLPDLGFGKKAEPKIPISVAYAFDPSVTQAFLEVDACGLPYKINTGEIIPQAFLAIGQEQFSSVVAYSGSGQAVQASQQSDLTVHLQLVQQSFRPTDKLAQEDTFVAFVNLQMLATFMDSTGKQLGQTPLNYSANASLWTPALTSSSISCVTSTYDDEMSRAAGELAKQLVSVIPQLTNQNQQQAVTAQAPQTGQNQFPAPTLPALKFRTMLKDGNNNLILEGGEALALQIEATNSGSQSLSAVSIELEGSPTLIRAFSETTPLPIAFGDFQPGETKTTEVRGRMPFQVTENKGELVVTLKPLNGSIVGSHRILAALQSANQSTEQGTSSPLASKSPQQKIDPTGNKYVAVLIGLDQYRDKWPKAYKIKKGQLQAMKNTLQTTGVFSDTNIRVLQGSHAAKTDIEEALLSWGRQRLGKDSVLIVHFSGQALNHPTTGEVYLVPFEGSPTASAKRLISLRTLQRVLGKMDHQLTLLLLDTQVTPLHTNTGTTNSNGATSIKWTSGIPISSQEGKKIIQVRRNTRQRDEGPVELLSGLLGRADANGNGTITIGEYLEDVKSRAEVTAAPSKNSPEASIPLAQ